MLILISAATPLSCTPLEGEGLNFMELLVPVETVVLPEDFVPGKSFSVELVYRKPTECHSFTRINTNIEENNLYFGVVNQYDPTNPDCIEISDLTGEKEFNITLGEEETYNFHFWQGFDENDSPIFLTREIKISEPEPEPETET